MSATTERREKENPSKIELIISYTRYIYVWYLRPNRYTDTGWSVLTSKFKQKNWEHVCKPRHPRPPAAFPRLQGTLPCSWSFGILEIAKKWQHRLCSFMCLYVPFTMEKWERNWECVHEFSHFPSPSVPQMEGGGALKAVAHRTHLLLVPQGIPNSYQMTQAASHAKQRAAFLTNSCARVEEKHTLLLSSSFFKAIAIFSDLLATLSEPLKMLILMTRCCLSVQLRNLREPWCQLHIGVQLHPTLPAVRRLKQFETLGSWGYSQGTCLCKRAQRACDKTQFWPCPSIEAC